MEYLIHKIYSIENWIYANSHSIGLFGDGKAHTQNCILIFPCYKKLKKSAINKNCCSWPRFYVWIWNKMWPFSLLVCWYMFVGCHLSYITFDPTRRNWISFSYLVHKTPTEEKMCFNFKSFSHLRIWYPTFVGYFVISKTSTLENVIMDPFRASINSNLFPIGNRSLRVFLYTAHTSG